jgi:excisionase family DNA binding protein
MVGFAALGAELTTPENHSPYLGGFLLIAPFTEGGFLFCPITLWALYLILSKGTLMLNSHRKPPGEIPTEIVSATVNLLKPYCPAVTAERVRTMLSEHDDSPPDRLITRQEVSDILQLSLPTTDRLIKSSQLASVKIRRSVRVPLSAVTAFIAECQSDRHI